MNYQEAEELLKRIAGSLPASDLKRLVGVTLAPYGITVQYDDDGDYGKGGCI